MARRTLTGWLLPLLLSLGVMLLSTAWAADRQALARSSTLPPVPHTPDTAARSARQHGLPALLRSISDCLEAPPVGTVITQRVARAITLGLRN